MGLMLPGCTSSPVLPAKDPVSAVVNPVDPVVAAPPVMVAQPVVAQDGVYSGLSILTSFHGDCNAGGTGEVVLRGDDVVYRDARNPLLHGPMGRGGDVDLASGTTRLTGHFDATQFVGRIAGGPCGYELRFDRIGD